MNRLFAKCVLLVLIVSLPIRTALAMQCMAELPAVAVALQTDLGAADTEHTDCPGHSVGSAQASSTVPTDSADDGRCAKCQHACCIHATLPASSIAVNALHAPEPVPVQARQRMLAIEPSTIFHPPRTL